MQQQRGNAVASTSQQQQPSQSQSQAQPSSQSQTTTTTTAPNGGGQEVDPTYKALELGSKVIDERLQRDERWSGVGDCLTRELILGGDCCSCGSSMWLAKGRRCRSERILCVSVSMSSWC